MLDYLHNQCISYFLSHYDPRSPKKNTKDVVKRFLSSDFSAERVGEFLDIRLPLLKSTLVEEFNSRLIDGRPLRFEIADSGAVGDQIRGFRGSPSMREHLFQDSLGGIEPAEFELLAAVILRRLGCYEVYSTPQSHDQGVDAFGHCRFAPETPYGVNHNLTWIAQAKHYRSTRVSTGDVRELVGSRELLLAKAFSTVDERYRELTLRKYAPTAVALITAEEIPTTVRRLAENAGVYVFASSDIFHLLAAALSTPTVQALRDLLLAEGAQISMLA